MKYNPHLILMSYWKAVSGWFIEYLKNNQVVKIAYIMNASKAHVKDDPGFIFNDAELYRKAGFIVDIIDLDLTKDIESKFREYDLIYVRGGNTFDLLESFRSSGFDKILPNILKSGVIYASSSAGSILPGPSIEVAENDFAPDYNNNKLKDLSGMGIVDFAIFPHWDEKWREQLNALKEKLSIKYEVKTLKDNQVILVKDNKLRLVEL